MRGSEALDADANSQGRRTETVVNGDDARDPDDVSNVALPINLGCE